MADVRRNDQWTGVANAIATMVVGIVLFGVGVGDNFGSIEVVGGLVIAGGAVALVVALLRSL